jgi:hypothetical protein
LARQIEMGNPVQKIQIIVEGKDASGAATLQTINKELDNTSRHTQNAKAGIEENTNALGMNRREWMRTGSEATFYLTSIAGKSGDAGKALSQVTGMVTQLGESFMFGGGVGVAIAATGIAVSTLANALDMATPQTKAYHDSIASLEKADDAAKGLARLSGATQEQAQTALDAAKGNKGYAQTLIDLEKAAQQANKNGLERAGDSLGMLVQMTGLVASTAAPFLSTLKDTGDLSKANAAYYDAMAQSMTGLTKAQREQLAAAVSEGERIKETSRLYEIHKNAIIGAAEENKRYAETVGQIESAHTKAMAGFGRDVTEAQRKAGMDRERIEQDTVARISDINRQLSTRIVDIQQNLVQQIGDIERQHTQKLSDDYYQYAKSIEALNRDIAKSAQDTARQSAQIEKDYAKGVAQYKKELQKSLADIDADQQEQLTELAEQTAHDKDQVDRQYWGREAELKKQIIDADAAQERAKILRDAEKRRQEAQQRALERQQELDEQRAEQLAALEERKREAAEEQEYRRQQVNETYARSKETADREMREQIERAQRTSDDQIAQARRTAAEQTAAANENKQKQIEAVQQQLTEQLRAIGVRRADELAAYEESKQKSAETHAQKIQELTDERTEAQKLSDAMKELAGPSWDPWITKAQEYERIVNGLNTPPSGSGGGGGGGSSGFGANGLDMTVPPGYPNDSFLFHATSGEHVAITPPGQAGARVMITGGINFYGIADGKRAADEFVQGLRARGIQV